VALVCAIIELAWAACVVTFCAFGLLIFALML